METTQEVQRANSEVEKLSKTESIRIFKKIDELSKKIEIAEVEAKNAKNTSGGFFGFGTTKKRSIATADALIKTNEAVSEMNNLIQESIKFTCSSLILSKCMFENLSEMTKNGFIDRDGRLKKINKKGQEFASHLLEQAKAYINQQEKLERTKQISKENSNKLKVQEETDLRHDRELEAQAETDLRHDRELEIQAETDLRHDKEIESLIKTKEQLELRVKNIEALIQENEKKAIFRSESLNSNKPLKVLYIIVLISLALSAYSLYLSFSN